MSRLEKVCHLRLFRCRQPNPSHLFQPPLLRNLTRGYLKKDARSSGACMSAIGAGEDKRGIKSPDLRMLHEDIHSVAHERHRPPLGVLGLLKHQEPTFKVNIIPAQAQELHLPGSGRQGKHDHG
jgi:hypothetical protein